jgi:hypothetical protein
MHSVREVPVARRQIELVFSPNAVPIETPRVISCRPPSKSGRMVQSIKQRRNAQSSMREILQHYFLELQEKNEIIWPKRSFY